MPNPYGVGNVPTYHSPGTGPTATRPGYEGKIDSGRLLFVRLSGGSRNSIDRLFKEYQTQAKNMSSAMTEVNRRAVVWLSARAQKQLKERIRYRGREQSRNQSLVELAGSYKLNSSFTNRGFHFFDPNKVRDSAAFPYYRAIEFGSRHSVGQRIPLAFIRGGRYVRPEESPRKDYVTYRGGEHNDDGERIAYYVQIKRPIPAYYYITTAVESFKEERIYRQIILGMIRQRAPLLYRAAAGRERDAIRLATGSTGRP